MFITVDHNPVEIKAAVDLIPLSIKVLTELYNDLTGSRLKKFSSKQQATARVWKAIQEVDHTPEEAPKPTNASPRRKNRLSKVRVLSDGNPFREASLVWNRWNNANPQTGDTIEQLGQRGLTGGDINWCLKKNNSLEILDEDS